MILRNSIGIETRYGYRTFDLYEGDVTNPQAAADLLVVSSFAGSYIPSPGTLFAALYEKWGFDVRRVRRQFDLRIPLSIWISQQLKVTHFRRLLCVEMVGGSIRIEEALANVFVGLAILEAKGMAPRSLVLPVLGAGSQHLDPDKVIAVLIPEAKKALERSPSLERILFIDRSKARVNKLALAMDMYLGRSNVRIPKGKLKSDLRADICTTIDTASKFVPESHRYLFSEMKRILGQESAASFEVGMLARRLVEFIVNDILQKKKTSPDLISLIENTAEMNLAPWIRSYMHTLRLIGNESAHDKSSEDRRPPYVSEEDLVICLFCIQRVLGFWLSMKQETS